MRYEMTTVEDENPRGILLYSTHCVYNPSFSNFHYSFPQVSRQEQKDFFFSPSNKSPHTEVNNINTYVSGVKAGALLKLIFQNVFLLLLQLQGSPPLRTSLSYNQSLCGGSSEEGRRTWEHRPGYVSIPGSVPQTDTDLEQKIRDKFSLDSFLRSLCSCLPLYLLGLVTATLQNHQQMPFVDAHLESHLQLKCSIPQIKSHQNHRHTLCFLLPEDVPREWRPGRAS